MPELSAIYFRTKEVSVFPLGGNRYLISASLRDEVHDVHVDVELTHPNLEIVAARSEVRNGPFTNVCNMTHPHVEKLIGMKVGRGFTLEARRAVGGEQGCHRVSELVVEIAQAAYQLHFAVLFSAVPKEQREAADVPIERWRAVNNGVPGMRNTCFSYNDKAEDLIESQAQPLRLLDQDMPVRNIDTD